MISSELERSNLHGLPLRVAAVISDDYAYDTAIVQNSDGSFRFENSFSVELLQVLEFTMNFTTIPVITNAWGHFLPNKTWVGMIALLLANKADLGLSSIADRPFRRAVVDFNIPTNEIRLAAFFKRPSAFASSYSALIKPFQPLCWVVLLLVLVAMIFTSYSISAVLHNISQLNQQLSHDNAPFNHVCRDVNVHPQSWDCKLFASVSSNNSKKPRNEDLLKPPILFLHHSTPKIKSNWSKTDCVLWSLTTLSLRGFYNSPLNTPMKIVMLVGSLCGVVLFAAYSGVLVSFLSVLTEPIQTLGQLLATDFSIVIVNDPLASKFLSESPDVKGVMLYNRRRTEKSYSSMKEAYEEINKGSFVFVTDHASAYDSLTKDFFIQEACRIREIEIENAQQKQGTLVQKNSPYKRIIDYQILRTLQFGLVKRWSSRFLNSKPLCEASSVYEGVALSSSTVSFAVLILFGWLIGLFGLCMEVCLYKRSIVLSSKRVSNTDLLS